MATFTEYRRSREGSRGSDFELRELWRRYRDGDDAARESLVLNYSPLVKVVAGRLRSRLPPQVEENDLISFGLTGLLGAIERFDAGRGAKFETFALFRIQGAMLDALRSLDWVPRRVRQNARDIERTESRLRVTLERAPKETDLARSLGLDLETLRAQLLEIADSQLFSFDAPLPGQDANGTAASARLLDVVASHGVAEPQPALDADESGGNVGAMIAKAVSELPKRQQFILTCRYRGDLRLGEIGEVLGLTESRVSQLHAKSLISLRAAIGVVDGGKNLHLAHSWN